MSRVWKKFFRKLAEPLGYMAYIIFAVGLSVWTAENVNESLAVFIAVVMIVIPAFAFLIRDMWRDAKREVEWENKELLRDIKGK